MKIAITSQGKDLNSQVDPRFGRAAYIIIVDTETMDFEVIDNAANKGTSRGAGTQTASNVSEKGAEVLLTGFCGPNAFKTLDAANIKVGNDATGTIQDAVDQFKAGKFEFATDANVDGHW